MKIDKTEEKGYYILAMKNGTFFTDNIIKNSASFEKGCAVAVGSFDGVHLGHKAMIESLSNEAKKRNIPAVAVTFDVGNSPKSSLGALANEEKKRRLLSEYGADVIISFPFDELKRMSAEDFAKNILLDTLNAKAVVCGYDFRFGNDKKGDFALLQEILSPFGVEVVTPSVVLFDENPISSTAIRNLISNGNVELANRLLGYEFSFESEIITGRQLGRTLGFPTANQKYDKTLVPLRFGVYAVKCVLGGNTYNGVANFGIKPTVDDSNEPVCETFIFDYCGDCYGETAEIRFLSFIREEKRFSSLDELSRQVESDKLSALKYFSEGE